jgi:hypothetical protein
MEDEDNSNVDARLGPYSTSRPRCTASAAPSSSLLPPYPRLGAAPSPPRLVGQSEAITNPEIFELLWPASLYCHSHPREPPHTTSSPTPDLVPKSPVMAFCCHWMLSTRNHGRGQVGSIAIGARALVEALEISVGWIGSWILSRQTRIRCAMS